VGDADAAVVSVFNFEGANRFDTGSRAFFIFFVAASAFARNWFACVVAFFAATDASAIRTRVTALEAIACAKRAFSLASNAFAVKLATFGTRLHAILRCTVRR